MESKEESIIQNRAFQIGSVAALALLAAGGVYYFGFKKKDTPKP